MQNETEPQDTQAYTETLIKKRILWSSNREDPKEYYADKLEILQIDDGKWALRLSVGGTVSTVPIKNIDKYV